MAYVQSPEVAPSTFSLAVWVQGTPASISTDSDPNSSAPAAGRILRITPKRDCVVIHGNGSILGVAITNTVSYVVWFYDDTLARWVAISAATAVAANSSTAFTIRNMCGARVFVQITAVNAATTAFGYDFV